MQVNEPQAIDTRSEIERFNSMQEFQRKLADEWARLAAYAPPASYLLRPGGTLEELRTTPSR